MFIFLFTYFAHTIQAIPLDFLFPRIHPSTISIIQLVYFLTFRSLLSWSKFFETHTVTHTHTDFCKMHLKTWICSHLARNHAHHICLVHQSHYIQTPTMTWQIMMKNDNTSWITWLRKPNTNLNNILNVWTIYTKKKSWKKSVRAMAFPHLNSLVFVVV